MIRTRDFAIYLVVLIALLLAIAVTLVVQGGVGAKTAPEATFVTGADEYEVVVSEEQDDRASYLARLRDKLGAVFVAPDPETITIEAEEEEGDENTDVESADGDGLLLCNDNRHQALFNNWPTENVSVRALEGARLVVHAPTSLVTPPVATSTATSTLVPKPARVVSTSTLLQLPIQSARSTIERCIPTGIIGVRPDGAPFKNTDTIFYQDFLPTEVVGYTLDGFVLYGPTDVDTDRCGGFVTASGQYQYHVQEEGEYLLSCFGG